MVNQPGRPTLCNNLPAPLASRRVAPAPYYIDAPGSPIPKHDAGRRRAARADTAFQISCTRHKIRLHDDQRHAGEMLGLWESHMRRFISSSAIMAAALLVSLVCTMPIHAASPQDTDALSGLNEVKVAFDVQT